MTPNVLSCSLVEPLNKLWSISMNLNLVLNPFYTLTTFSRSIGPQNDRRRVLMEPAYSLKRTCKL